MTKISFDGQFVWILSLTLAGFGCVPSFLTAQTIVDGLPPGFELVRLTNNRMQESVPSINNLSEVVYAVYSPTDFGNIFLYSKGIIRQLSSSETDDWNPGINNVSQIVWGTRSDSQDGFSIASNYFSGLLPGADDVEAFFSINDAGDIVWMKWLGGSNFDIWLYNNEAQTVMPVSNNGNNQAPEINNLGQVIFENNTDQVLLYADASVTEVSDDCQICQEPDINDSGQMVWTDELVLQFLDKSNIKGVVSIPTGFAASTPQMNNEGVVSFGLWNPQLNLWHHAVLMNGTIYRLPDMGLTHSRRSINDKGELALRYRNQATQLQELYLLRLVKPKGDFDGDCDIDIHDQAVFLKCYGNEFGGEVLAECSRADFDEDQDIDTDDAIVFFAAAGGPEQAVANCGP